MLRTALNDDVHELQAVRIRAKELVLGSARVGSDRWVVEQNYLDRVGQAILSDWHRPLETKYAFPGGAR